VSHLVDPPVVARVESYFSALHICGRGDVVKSEIHQIERGKAYGMYSRETVSYTSNTEELLGVCHQLRSRPHYNSAAYVDYAPIFL
jgi:hypothetical protein